MKKNFTWTFTTDYEALKNALHQALDSSKIISNFNESTATATGTSSLSMLSWGQNFEARLAEAGPGRFTVNLKISTKLPTQLIDFGEQKKLAAKIRSSLEAQLGPAS